MKALRILSIWCLMMLVVSAQQDLVKKSQKILVLGDSITQAGAYVRDFESWLVKAYPKQQIELVNAGVSSETISGLSEKGHAGGRFPRPCLFERLERVLAVTQPDLIIACYGINCGVYKPIDKERTERYQNGILRLRAAAKQYGAEVVHVTPPFFDNHGKAGFNYNMVMKSYAAWLVEQRKLGWQVVDLHSEMESKILAEKKKNPKFTVQRDRIHPNEQGHWMMAQSLIRFFGGKEDATLASAHLLLAKERMQAVHQRAQALQRAIHAETKPLRPGVPAGGTMLEARKLATQLQPAIYDNH